ncbi:penicillin-binding protein 2 [Variovorax sp. NFACC27]|uniref:peptidoglycan D,D-transpeptidase FtsI family protein n=1 Tax=unclassified Variovorax TaxID=663243 RepID=UPI000896BE40|nr:penicillin-binding protein 2 [Variovorax sp. YR750]MDP9602880.1 cell division protein FtsI (penicillin-binding protein 3) [Variovorax paradoxus]SEF31695.1 cell division protein FtsI (penicillin-binding protein 3) [Variovorax sp. NFACC28]SEG81483.1 cell division protein FtsI (penicillin-binding protein 3) [Variovorax sp. NFACC29]SFD10872.1 cell division protein FtsI (penicillin-binding protein 3) [Variovorax sp. NFACC26]SFG17362.1 cell division protein FtsI (penicillin-binding protein 3) [Va
MTPNGRIRYGSSPLLASPTPVWRSKFIVASVAFGFLLLAGRAAYVQIFANDFFQHQGEVRYQRTLELPANRGRILDRNGLILASDIPAPSIWAIPEDIERDDPATQEKLRQAAKLLGMPQKDFDKKLEDEDKSFVWIKRQVDEPVAKQVAALNIKGIYLRRDYRRQYPEGEAAAHLAGFTNVEDIGQEGIELAFDHDLAGKAGSRHVLKDRLGHIVEDTEDQVPPTPGHDIQLSIDDQVQFVAYEKIRDAVIANKARAGSVVVVNAQTGELLAMANYPSYDPNDRHSLTGEQLRNRAMTDVFEPGSTMKPITVATALQLGRVTPKTIIDTNPGRITVSGATIHDDENFGVLTVEGVIQKSSNVGATKISQRMSAQEMWNSLTAVGLGQKPQTPFPGAVTGRLRPWKSWRPIEQATMSYGYGLSASLFQIAHAYTAFAHDGEVIPISLLKNHGEEPAGVQVFSPLVASEVRQMMHMAAAPGGTAPLAQTVGYSVGGKTGTAHKQVGKGYASNKYRAWYTGMSPIDKPRIIVAVMVDEPSAGKYFGGLVAAPVFSQVVQQTLRIMNVVPDLAVTSMAH